GVAVQDELGTVLVQQVPHRLELGDVLLGRAEAGLVPVGGHAGVGMAGQFAFHPLVLVRSFGHADVRVEGEEVPGPDIPGVVPEVGVTGGAAEVRVVPGPSRSLVLVVPGHRAAVGLVGAPGEVVGSVEVGQIAVFVLLVAEGEDPVGPREQPGGVLLPALGGGTVTALEGGLRRAAGDVAGRHEDGVPAFGGDRNGGE